MHNCWGNRLPTSNLSPGPRQVVHSFRGTVYLTCTRHTIPVVAASKTLDVVRRPEFLGSVQYFPPAIPRPYRSGWAPGFRRTVASLAPISEAKRFVTSQPRVARTSP
jgi:hypothetical protein